jgi:MarR family 2-MHQ and catechol resistance regulon transcriptional repressor
VACAITFTYYILQRMKYPLPTAPPAPAPLGRRRGGRAALLERFADLQPKLRRRFEATLPAELRDELAAGMGHVTVRQLEVLRRIEDRGPMPMHEIAALHGGGPSGATQLVDRMERQGLVERQACPEDRRVVQVAATERATALTGLFRKAHRTGMKSMFNRLDDLELETFVRLLEKMAGVEARPG